MLLCRCLERVDAASCCVKSVAFPVPRLPIIGFGGDKGDDAGGGEFSDADASCIGGFDEFSDGDASCIGGFDEFSDTDGGGSSTYVDSNMSVDADRFAQSTCT